MIIKNRTFLLETHISRTTTLTKYFQPILS